MGKVTSLISQAVGNDLETSFSVCPRHRLHLGLASAAKVHSLEMRRRILPDSG